MLNLIYKDLRVGLPFLLLAGLVFILGSIAAVRAPAFFWVCLVFATALMFGQSQMDWRHGLDRFVHSLPVSRDLVVYSRYGSAMLGGALTLAIAGSAGVLRGMTLESVGLAWPRMMSFDVGLAWLLLFAAIVSLYLPCYFRWGHGKGYIIGALAIAGGVMAGGFIQEALGRGEVVQDLPQGLVVSIVVDAAARLGLPLTALLVLGASGILLLASARVSVRACSSHEF
jgi:hypothetical protein